MDFRILGPLEILDGDRVLELPGGRGRALLALLILHPGEVISTERLINELWGETSPPTAVKALQGRVSHLRKRLESDRGKGKAPALLRTAPPGYVLDIDPSLVDANRFRQLVAEAAESPASERSTKLRQALRLWRGAALADFVYEPFAQREIPALEELRVAAIEMRVEADLELGLHHELIAELEAMVAEHPFREGLRAQLMLALYRAGRQAEALAAYANTRGALVEELGVEPGPMLRELEKAILHQDPSIDRERSPETHVNLLEPLPYRGKSWLPSERRTLTVILVHLTITGIDRADPEAVRRVVARATDVAAGVLNRHGATVEELVGDVVMGIFGMPAAHEDDVLRAARAAAELPAALAPLSLELRRDQRFGIAIRAGMESGEVLVGASDSSHARIAGDAVNVAADLQRAARLGEVLVGDAAHRILREATLMEPVEPSERAGRSSPAWRLIDVVPGAPALARRLDAPIVGRTAELARLQDSFQRAVLQRLAYRFTVLGDAGVGKSRLAAEFAEALGSSARVLTGHCPAYGEGITLRPLREVVMQAAGSGRPEALAEVLADEDKGEWIVTQVASALGLTQEPVVGEELFTAFRRLFEILSDRGPLVIILEDVHWAEPTLLDLIDHVTGRARGPIFLLCLARPELIEERPTWGAGGRSSDTLFLEPLDATETEKLIADRVAGGTLPPETLARIVETAQGNPLFAEQMVAAFQDEGTVMIPASADALLAARLDRLGPAERDLLRCASVAGTEFAVDVLVKLVPEQARPFVDRHLQALQRKQLIRPAQAAGRGFSFRHVLIQRAAYRSMTRQDRAKLHRRFAEWLQSKEAKSPPEFDETLGYHLEQAVEQRRALGGADEQDHALAVRAGEHLANAATRAFARFDIWATENLSSRAKSLLPTAHPRRLEVMRVLAETYPMMGRHDDADGVLAEMLVEGQAKGDHSLEEAIRLERARIRLLIGPDPTSLKAIRQEAERALEVFGASGDDARAAQACYVLGTAHERMGNTREMEAISRRGLDHGKRSGRPREEAGPLWNLAWAVRAGATPVRDAIRTCEELAQWRGTLHPGVLCELAHLRAMAGNFDEARELISRARQLMVERMRMRRPLMWAARSSAAVEMLLGDSASGERDLRTGLEMALDFGERDVVSRIAARLSRSLSLRGEPQEARRFATMSYEYAPTESIAAQALWRVAKAWTGSRDDPPEAERLAREAIRLTPAEMFNLRAGLHLELAEILLEFGDREGAMPFITTAIGLYARKGNTVSAARARSLAE